MSLANDELDESQITSMDLPMDFKVIFFFFFINGSCVVRWKAVKKRIGSSES